jgi:hypothetical protein
LAAILDRLLSAGGGSGLADDERFAGGVDDFGGDRVQAVDLQDTLDLGEEACEEAEVAVGGTRDRADGLGVGEVCGAQREAEALPVVGEDEAQLVGAQRLVAVREAMRL